MTLNLSFTKMVAVPPHDSLGSQHRIHRRSIGLRVFVILTWFWDPLKVHLRQEKHFRRAFPKNKHPQKRKLNTQIPAKPQNRRGAGPFFGPLQKARRKPCQGKGPKGPKGASLRKAGWAFGWGASGWVVGFLGVWVRLGSFNLAPS